MAKFTPVPEKINFPQEEERIIALWESISAFERSIQNRATQDKSNTYVFYDGPPFATGLPHYGHFVTSTIKDVVARYWTMRGKYVERRFGWDTHGLPIEMETEKALGILGPTQIRNHGVDKFNEACRSIVLRYTKEWEQIIKRLGRWVDFKNGYKTMDPWFMESVWWVFSQLWDKGLVYQGFRVMPYSWRLCTPLSNFEANMDYRDVQDPALTVKLKLIHDPLQASLLIWTTTPWTLPSNLAVAVNPDVDYVFARSSEDKQVYVVAEARLESVLGKDAELVSRVKGSELVGKSYQPLLPYFAEMSAFRVVPSTHVTTEDGTGLVHMAPAFGQDDHAVCEANGIELVDPVDAEGNFTSAVSDWSGVNIKEADPLIIRKLKEQGSIFKHDTIQHSYPYCWRSGTPLIYKAVPTWFVNVVAIKDRMFEHNQSIHWVPEFVGDKRFGNWLKDAQDWAISRNRFWGTPIPIWRCDSCDEKRCVGSVEQLEKLSGAKVPDLHSHFVDKLEFPCTSCSGTMKRIPEVFDCWFESGSMPYAQMHYPFENQEQFAANFPAQFIAEGLDQTRAWFYTLLVLSTALFDAPPFKNVVVNGMVLAEDGSKMSKSKRNYPDPQVVMDAYGADALRAYLINSPVVRAEPLLFSEKGVKEVIRTVMLPLYNTWSFFVQYASIDGWVPTEKLPVAPKFEDRPELDRWILSRLQSLVAEVNTQMTGYYLYRVIPPMMAFIDDLTNWYVRRSRRRFWKNATDEASQFDKDSAYATLYEVLTNFCLVLSPVLPFMTEMIYQHLVVKPGMAEPGADSIHLVDYPQAVARKTDVKLEQDIATIRQVVQMGRALREKHRIKTRQPLKEVVVVSYSDQARAAILKHAELIESELNVKEVRVLAEDEGLSTVVVKPNFRTLGKRMGTQMGQATAAISKFTLVEINRLKSGETIEVCGVPLTLEDVTVARESRGDVVIETEGDMTVALHTQLDADLIAEGLMRETVSQLQKLRKDSGLEVTDRIQLRFHSPSSKLKQALQQFESVLRDEVLATDVQWVDGTAVGSGWVSLDVDGEKLGVELVQA